MVAAYFKRAYTSFAVHIYDIPARLLAFLFFLLLLSLPMARPSPYLLSILIITNIWAIYAVSWDLLAGRTGQVSLGHGLFLGIGAYSTALLFKYFGLPLWVTIPLSLVVGVSVALLIGFTCLRVKGPYLALVTMAFPLILYHLVRWGLLSPVTGGEFGIRDLPSFFPIEFFRKAGLIPREAIYQQQLAEYYLTFLLLVVSAIVLYKVAHSKTGIVFVSILDDELASKACGINVTKYKLMAFTISGLFASLAGSVQAHISGYANPPSFSLIYSFIPVIVTILGGIGTIYGPIVGTFIYYILDRYVLTILVRIPFEWIEIKLLIFILIVVILVIKWPTGIAKFAVENVLEELQKERELEERGKWIWKREKKKPQPEG